MSNHSLLNKERDFLELNKELEDKVKSLMVEVDTIISKQEDVIRSPRRPSYMRSRRYKSKLKESLPTTESDEEQLSDSNDDDDDHVPVEAFLKNGHFKERTSEEGCDYDDTDGHDGSRKKKKRSTKETIIRFLKAQVTRLQADLQAAQYESKKKTESYKELEGEIKKHEQKREKLQNQLASQKETILKAEVSNNELQARIQTQNAEIVSLKKEIENLKKDLKSLNQISSNSDLRLNRSLEENEKLRSSLRTSQAEEKELREQIRKLQEEKRLALKNAEKQRTDIFQAFKKQTQLVDNLKKQKAYLEASKEIQFIEEDFTRLLEWKPDKV
ncbi:testis-expressed protein 9 isoform X1 [Nasonia vitripennis]|uniref:Uncharacterized protein n=1 Tax=Nasonia vitripennis TaxID=7425 RepID=A0A7M7LJT7_NASVI|nr:testis-expressed protein 9 isoform X1 [Nasonia vitripennis]